MSNIDKKALHEWLMEEVEEDIDGERKTLSRMDMAKELHAKFLKERNNWHMEKKEKHEIYKNNDDLEGYAHWLSNTGHIKEEKLNHFYKETIVGGRYGEVLNLLAFLNVTSAPEKIPSEN